MSLPQIGEQDNIPGYYLANALLVADEASVPPHIMSSSLIEKACNVELQLDELLYDGSSVIDTSSEDEGIFFDDEVEEGFNPEKELNAHFEKEEAVYNIVSKTGKLDAYLAKLPVFDMTTSRAVLKPFLKRCAKGPVADICMKRLFQTLVDADHRWPVHQIEELERTWNNRSYQFVAINRAIAKQQRRVDRNYDRGANITALDQSIFVRKGKKHVSKIWRFPLCEGYPLTPKPTVRSYSHPRFLAYAFSTTALLAKTINKKTSFVSGNLAAQCLFYSPSFRGTKEQLHRLLSLCTFYVDDYNFEGSSPILRRLYDWCSVSDQKKVLRSIRIGDEHITGLNQVMNFGALFVKHKPLYRTVMQLFVEPDSVDITRLQHQLDKVFPPAIIQPEIHYLLTADGFPPLVSSKGVNRTTLTLEGNTPSLGRVEVDHTVNVALPADLHELLEDLDLPHSAKRIVAQIISFVIALCSSGSWQSTLAALLQFATGNDFVWNICSCLIERVKPVIQRAEGFSDTMESVKEQLKDAFAPLWEAIVAVCTTSVISQVFREWADTISVPVIDFISHLRKAVLATGVKTLAESIVEGILSVLRRIKSCIKNKSWAPLWGSRWSPEEWTHDVESLMTYYTTLSTQKDSDPQLMEELRSLVKKGLLPSYWTAPVSPHVYQDICNDRYKQGIELRDYFKKSPAVVNVVNRILARFRNFIDVTVATSSTMAERVAPFLVLYYGPAGTGKTNLAQQVAKAVANIRNYDPTSMGTYSWQMNVNFQDGLNHTHWHVLMDDIDQSVAPEAAGVDNNIISLMKLKNNAPYPVESANVEMKGKVKANPVFMSYCTNFFNAKVTSKVSDPNTFWRRLDMHVTVVPKAEFNDGGALNREAAAASNTHDMFEMHVRYYRPELWTGSNKSEIPLTTPEVMSFPVFLRTLHEKFNYHLDREVARLITRSQLGNFCEFCGLDTDKDCGCLLRHEGRCSDTLAFITALKHACESKIALARFNLSEYYAATPIARTFQNARTLLQLNTAITFGKTYWKEIALASGATLGLIIGALSWYRRRLEGREMNATGILPDSFYRAAQEFIPGVPSSPFYATHTHDDAVAQITRSHYQVVGPKFTTHGFLFSHNTVLVPSHVLWADEKDPKYGEILKFTHSGMTISVQVTQFNTEILPNKELALIKNGNFKSDIGISSKFWRSIDESISSFDEVELWTDVKLTATDKVSLVRNAEGFVVQASCPSGLGDCGAVYLTRFGKSWWITGMHYAGLDGLTMRGPFHYALGAVTCQLETERAATRLATTLQGTRSVMETYCRDPDAPIEFTKYPGLSEAWAARSHHDAQFYPEGTMTPPITGSTMSTKLKRSVIADDFEDLATEWCGEANYWRLPEFRGKMVDGKWVSPYTKAFATPNWRTPVTKVMWIALADYLNGIVELNNDGYAELSESQAITGVPGSYIHAANLKTSVGPPFNRKKNVFVAVIDGVGYMSEQIFKVFDAIEVVLIEKYIPAPLGLCTLKDEPVKQGKAPRVFTNLSFAYNMQLKMILAPVKSFMRANFLFFESAVGINMTSAECNKIPQALATIDPSLEHIEERDVKAMDKSWSGEMFDFVALFFYAVAFYLGLRAWRAYTLVLGIKSIRMCIKNDIFLSYWNPSGHDATVEINGAGLSIGDRYVYYIRIADKFPDDLVFEYSRSFFTNPLNCCFAHLLDYRMHHALIHYGDDSLLARRQHLIHDDDYEIWKSHLGMEVTGADKAARPVVKSLKDSTFLKRGFVWDPETNSYLPPLSLKSMARTLMFKRETTLTDVDSACTSMSEVMKECVYYGEEFYENFRSRCVAVVKKYGWESNSCFKSHPYEHWRLKVLAGNFQTWAPPVVSTPPAHVDSNDS
jgi:hypothetical protein